jgi:hypothetical protein
VAAVAPPLPLLVRVARGDVVDVQASMVAVGHLNDVAPTGAEKALDDLLGGAITRRATLLRGRMGTTHFLPTIASPLAAGCVVLVCLGEPEHFSVARLAEAGAALVDAAATVGVRDVATVVPGASAAETDVRAATALLVTGALNALLRIDGAATLRELTVVEKDPARYDAVLAGVQDAVTSPAVHVYVAELAVRRAVVPRPGATATPMHLRLGITRSGPDLKVTRIGDDAFDRACVVPYPADLSTELPVTLRDQVLLGGGRREKRAERMGSIGAQLFNAFLADAGIDAERLIADAPDGLVLLRLDASTVDLPWELARLPDGRYLGRAFALSRQVELGQVGRAAAFTGGLGPLCALVVGNAAGGLRGPVGEAKAVARHLRAAGGSVDLLCGEVTYAQVSAKLNERSYDVLHYAGHAQFVEGRPEASGFVLADALLTPTDLGTRRFIPRLVVANACHSAAVASPYAGAEETRTLVTGLLSAGARAFVGAMWQVDDAAAVTFARAFYDAAGPGGPGPEPVGEAVRRGREAVVAEHGEVEPSWAAYALYGSPWRTIL